VLQFTIRLWEAADLRKNPLSNMSAHGGIITSEFLETIRGDNAKNPRVEPPCFATLNVPIPPKDKRELDRQIESVFKELLERWDALSNRYQNMSISEARSKWMLPLFKEFGFNPDFRREEILVGGDDKLRFRISHRGWSSESAPMIHMVAPAQDLEEASEGNEGEVVRRGRTRSPHDEMQTYLNVTKGSKWGIVTNGILLRILREYYHTTTKGYVEFDLENIFRERSFTDFRAFYRVAHASRFLTDKDGISPLEQFYKESVAAGVTVGENLRQNVKKAIEALGNGFIKPKPELAKQMIEDYEFCKAYYAELLRVIYRLLFLLFAEQRAMLPTKGSIYIEEYSITRLREMAETRHGKDHHLDLWEGLKVTFRMLKKGCPPLKVFGYNGTLFDDSELPKLSELSCKNEDILEAVRNLTLIEEERVLKRINYLDLGVSEIGSIYESLLDFSPKIFASEQEIEGEKIPANSFVLDPRGAARKTSGSYYTSPRLIDELIKSALKPVFEERVLKTYEKEKALLSIKICDPACGSGAFLIAANNFLGKELAKLRTNQPEPSDKEVKSAIRDVLQHCIYGVDLNPMATELAKVSLWINSCVEDMPLNFLDHHIKCGNSLIGVTPELLNGGIPDEAFNPVEGDDKNFAKRVRSRNSFEAKNKLMTEFGSPDQFKQAKDFASLDDSLEKFPEDVEKKKQRYAALTESTTWQMRKVLADTWTAAFFWQLDVISNPPTEATFRTMRSKGIGAIEPKLLQKIEALASNNRFFHWYLEFPDVFARENSGFDCLLGNPPWERIKLQEKEFFEAMDTEIAVAANASKRKALINDLKEKNPLLWQSFLKSLRSSETESKFIRFSGRYPLTARGDINTYAIFSEHASNFINQNGLSGIIVPTGIATDDTNKEFFNKIVISKQLSSLFDFENKEGLFQSVHRSYKFSLVTIGKLNRDAIPKFAFFIHNIDELKNEEKMFELTEDDFILLNPNTKTCPIFRSRTDAVLTKKIYKHFPILFDESKSTHPWEIKLLTMFHMANASHLFKNKEELEKEGFTLNGNLFSKNDLQFLPLYEGKMLQLFDHRAASIIVNSENLMRQGLPDKTSENQHTNINFTPLPRYWVPREKVLESIPEDCYSDGWLFGFKKVTSPTNERTFIGGVFPISGVGDSMSMILFKKSVESRLRLLLIANMSSRVFDYVSRQKIGGVNMNLFIASQLPVIPHSMYPQKAIEIVNNCMLELIYTSRDIVSFAASIGFKGDPFIWSPQTRAELIAKLEAVYGILYGIDRQEFEYVFDCFWSTKRQETDEYGEYKSKIMALQYFDEYLPLLRSNNESRK